MRKVRFIGRDVHADTIAVAVAEPGDEVRSLGLIPNRPESVRKLMKTLGPPEPLRVCYEARSTGYVIYWQLTALGVKCEVVAPTNEPSDKPGTIHRCEAPNARRLEPLGDYSASEHLRRGVQALECRLQPNEEVRHVRTEQSVHQTIL